MYLDDYLTAAFAALGSPETRHRGNLARFVSGGDTLLRMGCMALLHTIDRLRGPPAIDKSLSFRGYLFSNKPFIFVEGFSHLKCLQRPDILEKMIFVAFSFRGH